MKTAEDCELSCCLSQGSQQILQKEVGVSQKESLELVRCLLRVVRTAVIFKLFFYYTFHSYVKKTAKRKQACLHS